MVFLGERMRRRSKLCDWLPAGQFGPRNYLETMNSDLTAMRVAALYDIHSHLPALEAVLEEIEQERVDLIVVGGDVVPGPMPRETIARLLDLDIPTRFITGNGDREVVAKMRGIETGTVPERFRHVIGWVASQLGPEQERLLAGWPKTVTVEIAGLGAVLFCHATPRNDVEIFTRETP